MLDKAIEQAAEINPAAKKGLLGWLATSTGKLKSEEGNRSEKKITNMKENVKQHLETISQVAE